MRKFLLILFAFVFLKQMSFATDNGNLAYPQNFTFSPKKDNKVAVNSINHNLDIQGSFNLGVSGIFLQHFTEVKTNIAVVDGANVLFSIDGPDIKKTTDFVQSQQFSIVKNFNITIPQSTVSNIITSYPNAKLVIRYKIAYNSNSSILPNVNTSGWLPKILGPSAPDYYIHQAQYSFIDNRPRATISGPDTINTEGNFIASNAATFRVLPAGLNNVINATYLHNGSGHYLIKANEGFIGDLYLEAIHYDGLATIKKVVVKGPPLSITGAPSICSESIYTITSASAVTLENATGIATLTSLGNNQYKVTRLNSANGVVTIKAVNSSRVIRKDIIIGTIAPVITAPTETTFNSTLNITSNISGGSSAKWNVIGLPEGSSISSTTSPTLTINIPHKHSNHPNSGYFIVELQQVTACGISSKVTKFVNWYYGSPGPGDDQGPQVDP